VQQNRETLGRPIEMRQAAGEKHCRIQRTGPLGSAGLSMLGCVLGWSLAFFPLVLINLKYGIGAILTSPAALLLTVLLLGSCPGAMVGLFTGGPSLVLRSVIPALRFRPPVDLQHCRTEPRLQRGAHARRPPISSVSPTHYFRLRALARDAAPALATPSARQLHCLVRRPRPHH